MLPFRKLQRADGWWKVCIEQKRRYHFGADDLKLVESFDTLIVKSRVLHTCVKN